MAAQGSRTLKLSLLADVAEFTKGIKTAGKDTETIGDKFTQFGQKTALAFAAAGAAIGAFAVESVKNAAADEKAQRSLALTIENTTSATAAQIKGVEDYITKTSLAIGVTDDELRPAFARLTRSTKDVEESQKLLNLALDISSATGKPLEGVANALGKAYDGNTQALGRLGLGIDSSILKSKDFDLTFDSLTKTFGGFAENESKGTEKAFERIKIAVDEAQEQIGVALLPVVQKLTTYILTDVLPAFQQFINGLTGEEGLTDSLTASEVKALAWGKKVRGVIDTVIELKDEIIFTGAVIGSIFLVSKISAGVIGTIALIKSLIAAYNLLKTSAIVAGVASAFALNPLLGVGAAALAAGVLAAAVGISKIGDADTSKLGVPKTFSSISGVLGSTTPTVTAPVIPKIVTPTPSGVSKVASSASKVAASMESMGTSSPFTESISMGRALLPAFNVTVNQGIVGNPESAARAVVDVLNQSYFRGTGGATALQLAQ